MKLAKRLLCSCVFVLLAATHIIAQQATTFQSTTQALRVERVGRIDESIRNGIDKQEFAGAVGFVARNGKIVYLKAFGAADREAGAPMRTDAIFRIASQTKAITSIAVMMLFDDGKLLLDDPVSKYIPAFAKPVVLDKFNEADSSYTVVPARREVTIRDLLTHTSGIDYAVIGSQSFKAIYAKAGIPVGFEGSRVSLREAVDKLAKLPLAHQPGQKFTYGLNTDVLGCLVETLSGQTLSDFFRQRIFQPLGMEDTWFFLPENKKSRLVPIYIRNKQGRLEKFERSGTITADYPTRNGTYFSGGAGLSSTITDYGKVLQMMLNGGTYNGTRLLSRRSVELMTMNQIGDINRGDNKFGLGFEVITEKGQAKLGMTAGSYAWGGYFGTTYWVDPVKKIVAMIFLQQQSLSSDVHDKFKAAVYQALEE